MFEFAPYVGGVAAFLGLPLLYPLGAEGVASWLRQGPELRGGNPYRAKAYSRAADNLSALAVPLDRPRPGPTKPSKFH
jgi:hypothetical protein